MSDSSNPHILWDPWPYFYPDNTNVRYGILVLNHYTHFPFDPDVLMRMWNKASIRITVDGGTDYWLRWINKTEFVNSVKIDLITGDMDSISPRTLEYLGKIKTKIVRTPDQNETDFTKALRVLKNHIDDNKIELDYLIILVATCGRLDHLIGNINTMYKAKEIIPNLRIIKVAGDSFTWLLHEGEHKINIPKSILTAGKWCSLIPIGQSCTVTTTGLKWNLNETKLDVSQIISTSNTFNGENPVYVKTNHTIVWALCVKTLFQKFLFKKLLPI